MSGLSLVFPKVFVGDFLLGENSSPNSQQFRTYSTSMSIRSETQPIESDEALLLRVGRGDETAFGALYDRFSGRVYGMIRQMLRDEKEAEDVLQEGFVSVWEKAAAYDPDRGKAFPWVVMHLRHKAIDRLRARGRRAQTLENARVEWQTMAGEAGASTDEQVECNDRARRLTKAMNELPEAQRKLIEMAFLSGLTHHDISDQSGIPLGTVKTNIRRGLLKLRDGLKGGRA